MGNACSNCTSKDEESQFEMNEYNEMGNSSQTNPNTTFKPNRVAIQSQHLEELPSRYKGGQYVLDNSNQNDNHRVFSNDKMQQMLQGNIKSIIRVQAFIRRCISRKAIRECIEMRDMYRMHARYFTREELFETLSTNQGLGDTDGNRNKNRQYTYRNGAIYQGSWLGNFRNGQGRMDWSDGASYVGDWELGYASGSGVFIDCLGNKYVGQFKMSMAHGKGTYTNTMGAIYDGEWRYDMQHGRGTEKWTGSNSVFVGQFVDGLRNGYGTWLHKNKRYQGNWKNNMMDGQGTMEWGIITFGGTGRFIGREKSGGGLYGADTQQRQGANSLQESQNNFLTAADSLSNVGEPNEKGTYTGEWQANKMEGFGIFKWASGRIYVGEWAADMKDGIGILSFKGGNEYSGEFFADKRHGYGYYQWADNRKFKGWWLENKQHGLGVYFSPQSTSAKFGIWQMGKRVKWLSEQECESIRNGQLDYTTFFSLQHLLPNDTDKNLSQQQLLVKYRQIDSQRLQRLQEYMIGSLQRQDSLDLQPLIRQNGSVILFHCPLRIEKKLESYRKKFKQTQEIYFNQKPE